MDDDVVLHYRRPSGIVWRWNMKRFIDGVPLVIVENGKPLKDLMNKARVDDEDVLVAAREHHGLERMDQIKYAVLERSGGISIIPKESSS